MNTTGARPGRIHHGERLRRLKRAVVAASLTAFGAVSGLVLTNPVGVTSTAAAVGTPDTSGTGRAFREAFPNQAPAPDTSGQSNSFFGGPGSNPGLFGGGGGGSFGGTPMLGSGGS